MSNKYIKSPLNYVGGKYRLLKEILPLFPDKISTFVDVFGGSGTVLINVDADSYVYNDINKYVAQIFNGICYDDVEEIMEGINRFINKYQLSKTNREGFEKMRSDYNESQKNDWLFLYTLACYSFNRQIRFNNKHDYNSSFGENASYFSQRQKDSFFKLKERPINNIIVMSQDFRNINYSNFNKNDFLYFDPPYLGSIGSYNDGRRGFEGWSIQHEKDLLDLLDTLNQRGIRWALSNNLKYDNELLKEWLNKYKVYHLNANYNNCNYQKKDKTKDDEVLIVNY